MNGDAIGKYAAYRNAYVRRHKKAPHSPGETWREWWERKHKDDLESYHQRVLAREKELKESGTIA